MSSQAEPNARAPIDALLICALKDEYDQVRMVEDGLLQPGWVETTGPRGWTIADARFKTSTETPLWIRATWATHIGREQAQGVASLLIVDHPARCLAMSGICAGRRGKVSLGDVIFADRLWSYDGGKRVVEDGRERFQGDMIQFKPPLAWIQQMQNLAVPADARWLAGRPTLPLEHQEDWILLQLKLGCDPLKNTEFARACPDWELALDRLWKREWLVKRKLVLTEEGCDRADELALRYARGLTEPAPFQIHVAPIATGAEVTEDEGIFPRLANSMRKVLGVEMEASALGALAELHGIPVVVAKGVSDYGDPFKDDRYRAFAARAAAECLIALLRRIEALAVRGQAPGPELGTHAPSVCPYRGLRPFREEDAPLFHGRGALVERLFEAVACWPLVALVGSSGSGKSSVVQAGLLPCLRRDPSGTIWEPAYLVPTDRPLHAIAAVFVTLLEPGLSETEQLIEVSKLAEYLHPGCKERVRLRDVVTRVLTLQPETDRLILVVDQWEELYTLCKDTDVRSAFIDELLDATASGTLSVVLTLRGDFFGQLLDHRALVDRLQGAVVQMGPMQSEELRLAIEEPARSVGLAFEPGLVDRLIEAVGAEPGTLPLLEHVLEGLWERREGGLLVHDAYNKLGELNGAIMQQAEAIVGRLTPHEEQLLRRIFLDLTQPGDGTEDTRLRATLADLPEETGSLVRRLVDARLLVTGRDEASGMETIEVAHEALLRRWPRVRTWLYEDREFRLWRQRLSATAEDWRRRGYDSGQLLRGGALAEARRWFGERSEDLAPHQRDLLIASIRASRRSRGVRLSLQLVAALAVAALMIFTIVTVQQRAQLERQKDVLLESLEISRELTGVATGYGTVVDVGAADERTLVVASIRVYERQVALPTGNATVLEYTRARALVNLGQLLLELYRIDDEKGRTRPELVEEAKEGLGEAIRVMEALPRNGRAVELDHGTGIAMHVLSMCYRAEGDHRRAIDTLYAAIEHLSGAVAAIDSAPPDADSTRQSLTWVHNDLARARAELPNLLVVAGDARAKNAFREAITAYDGLITRGVEGSIETLDDQTERGEVKVRFGAYLLTAGHISEGAPILLEAGGELYNTAYYYRSVGELRRATAAIVMAIHALELTASNGVDGLSSHKSEVDLFRTLGSAANLRGDLVHGYGNLSAAEEAYRSALFYYDRASKAAGKRTINEDDAREIKWETTSPIHNLGEIAFAQRHYERAIEHFDRAISIETECLSSEASEPSKTNCSRLLRNHRASRVQALDAMGRSSEAADELRRLSDLAVGQWRTSQQGALSKDGAESLANMRELMKVLYFVGEQSTRNGLDKDGLEAARIAAEVGDTLAGASDEVTDRLMQYHAHLRYGELLLDQGRASEAEAACNKGLKLAREMLSAPSHSVNADVGRQIKSDMKACEDAFDAIRQGSDYR